MTHKCEYCEYVAKPGIILEKVKCTCDKNPETCEMESRIICDGELCQLKFKVDWYKIKLEESNGDIAKLKALTNQFRIANIGSQAAQRLVEDGTLEITGIRSFVTRQRLTWDEIPIETGYILMCLHEEFFKQWSTFLNEKAVKVQIKKDLIKRTEQKLAQAQKIRDGITNQDGTKKSEKQIKQSVKLTDIEKLVLNQIKLYKCTQQQSEEILLGMGTKLDPKPRNLKELGLT